MNDDELTTHRHWDELAAGHALDALDADAEREFTTHLEGCEHCQASIADHELVAAGLGALAHPDTPAEPPTWAAIRTAIVAVPQEPIDLASRRRRYQASRRMLATAAAAVVIAGGGLAIWRGANGGSSCSAAAGCHVVKLAAGHVTAASLTVRNTQVTMTPTMLRPAPSGEIYVLWQQPRDGQPNAIGEFTAAPGAPAVVATLQTPYADTQQFAVSLEKATGTPPTRPSNLLASGNAT
jgi:anti-sigma-K factor RskA